MSEDLIGVFKELFLDDENINKIGEKAFFDFMKRANKDLNSYQRYILVLTAVEMIKKGDSHE